MAPWRRWLANRFVGAAARRMRRRHPEWAQAVLNEHACLAGEQDQLDWAFGALRASVLLPGAADLGYSAVLFAALAAMAFYQWNADESFVTVGILCLLGVGLGCVRPGRFLVSGLAVGAVVAAVNGFETLSGVRPAYEVHIHSLAHDLRWLFLLAPALVSSAIGRRVGLSLVA